MKVYVMSLIAMAALSAASVSDASIVLWDINDDVGGTDATVADFTTAGVTEDLTGANVSLVLGIGSAASPMSDGNGVTVTLSANVTGPYPNGNSTNPILNDYLALRDNSVPVGVEISGLSSQLAANTDYSFYIWGAGDNAGQGSVLTFNGDTITVSQDDPDSSDGTDFVAKFSFTTDGTVSDTLDFDWDRSGNTRYGGLNGFAIVPVPEPSTLGLLLVAIGGLVARRRMFRG